MAATHEFGIMQDAPQKGERYDKYEPWEYNCISVDDKYLEKIIPRFKNIDFYCHTIDVKVKGLSYYGITLIPPCSIKAFVRVIKDIRELSELRDLSEKALTENKWIIHYGL